MISTLTHYSDIAPGIPSESIYRIYIYIYTHTCTYAYSFVYIYIYISIWLYMCVYIYIFWHSIRHSSWHIVYLVSDIVPGNYSVSLSGIYADISLASMTFMTFCFWYLFWHLFWLLWHSFWHPLWLPTTSILILFLVFCLASIPTFSLTWAVPTDICTLRLRSGPLRSGAGGWGPEVPKEGGGRKKWRRRKKDDEGNATLIKSRDPHLAGVCVWMALSMAHGCHDSQKENVKRAISREHKKKHGKVGNK